MRALHLLMKNLPWLPAIITALLIFHLRHFFVLYSDQLWLLTYQHLRMILLAMPPAIVLGVSLGILIYRSGRRRALVLLLSGVLFTVPSIALFGLMIPLLAPLGAGVGLTPAVLALILYSQLPIIRNTDVALRSVSPTLLKSARGMGMSSFQILRRVRLPLTIPIIFAGIRNAVVMGVGVAAVAAYIGGGGLGRWIFGGIRRTYPEMTLAGAVAVSLLAVILDMLLSAVQRRLTPLPLRRQA